MPPPVRRLEGTQLTDAEILRRAVVLVAVIFLGGGALLIGSAVFGTDHGGRPTAAPATPTPSALPTRAVTSPSPSPSVSPTAKPTRKERPKPTGAGMERFLRGYLDTVARDPAAAWPRLTPAFRGASGGFASYRQFWDTVTLAQPFGIVADPAGLTIGYQVTYTRIDGTRTSDSTRLRLVFARGGYRIDGEG